MEKKERSANDQKSDVKNKNNIEFIKDKENTAKQIAEQKRLDKLADVVINTPWLFSDNDGWID